MRLTPILSSGQAFTSTGSQTGGMGGTQQTRLITSLFISLIIFLFVHDLTRIAHKGNQFRALEEDEVMFLDSIRERQFEEERKRKEEDGVELASFREYVWSNCAEDCTD